MFRIGKERSEQALARPGAAVMDLTGKVMRGLVWVEADAALDVGLESFRVRVGSDLAALVGNSQGGTILRGVPKVNGIDPRFASRGMKAGLQTDRTG